MRKVCFCFTFTTANRYPIPTTQFYADRTPKVDVEKLKDIFENKQESLKIFEGKYQKLRHTREEMKKMRWRNDRVSLLIKSSDSK